MKLILTILIPLFGFAGPTGERVVRGSCTVERNGSETVIRQHSDRAILEWREFSIGHGEKVRIAQPSDRAAILHRVTGSGRSNIFGRLEANGRVYLLNRNGILIGPSGAVVARGFVGSTLHMSDDSFWSGGLHHFAGDSDALIRVEGRLEGRVYLIARHIEHRGSIAGEEVVLAAGSEVWACPEGEGRVAIKVVGDGTIDVAAAEIHAASDDPYRLALNTDGWIYLTGRDVAVDADSHLATGEGGTIDIWGDASAQFAGSAESPRGWVEISSKGDLSYTGHVSTVGSDGSAGLFLLDPMDIAIGGQVSDSPFTTHIAVRDLEAALQSNEVRLETSGGIGGSGTIAVQESIRWESPFGLILSGDRVTVAPGVQVESCGSGSLVLEANGTFPGQYVGVALTGATLKSASGAITLRGTGGDQGERNIGISVDPSSRIESATGAVALSGHAGTHTALAVQVLGPVSGGSVAIEGGIYHTVAVTAPLFGSESVAVRGQSVTVGRIEAGSAEVTGDRIHFGGPVKADALLVQPLDNNLSIGLGTGTGAFQLSQGTLDQFDVGALAVGRITGAHAIVVGNVTFPGELLVRGNDIQVTGRVAIPTATFAVGQTASGTLHWEGVFEGLLCTAVGGPYTDRFLLGRTDSVMQIVGGEGGDAVVGPLGGSEWTLTGLNTGFLGFVQFQGIPCLMGGLGDDVFQFLPGGGVTGSIAGNGGHNQFDYREYGAPIEVNLAAQSATGCPSYREIHDFKTLTPGSTLIAPEADNCWALQEGQRGVLNGETTFEGFTHLVGGGRADVFDASQASDWVGSIEGNGGDNRLIGPDVPNLWTVESEDAGSVSGIAFAGMQSLQGGEDVDIFAFYANLTGNLSGGGGENFVVGNVLVAGSITKIAGYKYGYPILYPYKVSVPSLSYSMSNAPHPPALPHEESEK